MDELIARIVNAVGIDEGLAQTAVGVILGFINKEGPSDAVGQLMGAIPGAQELLSGAADAGADSAGGLGGALGGLMGGGGIGGALGGLMGGEGGGLMAAAGELMGAGLDMDQIQGVASEVVGFAREKAGDDVVGQIVANIPGMDQFS
ncbi:MAG: DUF2267 domain-containing protein [Pseudomonadota bacterium]